MNILSSNGLFCVGTIRNDRTKKAPLQDISKAERVHTVQLKIKRMKLHC